MSNEVLEDLAFLLHLSISVVGTDLSAPRFVSDALRGSLVRQSKGSGSFRCAGGENSALSVTSRYRCFPERVLTLSSPLGMLGRIALFFQGNFCSKELSSRAINHTGSPGVLDCPRARSVCAPCFANSSGVNSMDELRSPECAVAV